MNELLSFTKADLRPADLKLEPVDVVEALQKVSARETRDGVDIRITADSSLRALAVGDLLSRALSNVLRNAIRYAGNSGPIELSAKAEGDKVAIGISDHGPGIPEEGLDAVFDPFYRPAVARERETGGVGLGLSIVKACVTACRGTVRCRNRKPSGLVVEITLESA